ncbi:MAG: hypothetical protein M5U12_14195 [Verrucomicrobia bacterium]|nr:hypothetical protein [Verrucomicrobiota bacterium]
MIRLLVTLVLAASLRAGESFTVSVYATAGDVLQHLATAEQRVRAAAVLAPLRVDRLFLEGRRGDEYVPPDLLREVRDDFHARGVRCAGGIATVPGSRFGTRQDSALSWLNWQSAKTQSDVAQFFRENAPLFDELIVDDFYCTADTSAESEVARGSRSWGEYRRDLLVSLIEPMIVRPAKDAHPGVRLILKYPQWYDRFHLFGYDPARMSPPFDAIWVGTEVRNPQTRRMGFVQPTEGYMNFRWLQSVAGPKVMGAWFDHIECSAQHFIDQAYQSVLAGARDLTLFRLGDLMDGHPGDALLAARLPDLQALAARVRGQTPSGFAFYKPPGSESEENLYLADYLGMIGLPVVPVSSYPTEARAVFLGVQAAADAEALRRAQGQVQRGGAVVVTPAFVRMVGSEAAQWAGVEVGPAAQPLVAETYRFGATLGTFASPLDVDGGVRVTESRARLEVIRGGRPVPLLTERTFEAGRVWVLNVRTFSEADFRESGEWLLAPKPRGLAELPEPFANELRAALLSPLGVAWEAPAGVGLYLFGGGRCLYNFGEATARVRLDGAELELPAHQWRWVSAP